MVKLYVTLMSFASDLGSRRRTDDEGATAVEYGLMVALIAAVIVGVVTTLGHTLDQKFHDVLNAITG